MADVALALAIPTLAGYTLAAAILGNRSTFAERLSLSYPAGMSLTTIFLFWMGLARIPFSAVPVYAALGATATACFMLMNARGVKPLNIKVTALHEYANLSPAIKAISLLLIIWIAFKLALVATATSALPIWSVDSKQNWTLRAAMFYAEGGLHLYGNDYFLASAGQSTYPLLSQLSQVWLAIAHGSFDRTVVKLWAPGFYASLGLFAYAAARKSAGIATSLLFALLMLSAPLLVIHSTEPYSDAPLSFFCAVAFLYAWKHMKTPERPSYAAMAGLFGAFALNTKLEGMIFTGLLTIALIAWALTSNACKAKRTAITAYLAPYALMAPFYIFKYMNHIGVAQNFNEYHTSHASGTVPLSQVRIFPLIFSYIFLPDNLNLVATILLPILLYSYYKQPRRLPGLNYAIAPLVAYVMFLIALYTFSVPHREFLESATIFYRNMMVIYPSTMLLALIVHHHLQEEHTAQGKP